MYYMENQQEIWKDIPGFEGYYQASTLGRILSLSRTIKRSGKDFITVSEKLLKLCLTTKGYQFVHLHKGTSRKTWPVHKLVAMTFLNHTPDGTMKTVVDHINHNKVDNRLCNLQLTTNRHNCSKDRQGKYSNITGVTYNKRKSLWLSQITVGNKNIFLGYFNSEHEAGLAYKKALESCNT